MKTLFFLGRVEAKAATTNKPKPSSGSGSGSDDGINALPGSTYSQAQDRTLSLLNTSSAVANLKRSLLVSYDKTTPPPGAVVRVQFSVWKVVSLETESQTFVVRVCEWAREYVCVCGQHKTEQNLRTHQNVG